MIQPQPSQPYLASVRDQYEDYPYPKRDPNDEPNRLVPTGLEFMDLINHYCFGGMRNWQEGMRILVAGCGTGDGAIHLAEQLRGTGGEVVAIDISQASLDIARKRAEIRRLDNITFHHLSLLEVGAQGWAPFDYINCVGVLHHLEDRDAGLAALEQVLADDGAMGLMVYNRYARAGIIQMQDALRLLTDGMETVEEKIDCARDILDNLPEMNLARRTDYMHRPEIDKYDDIGIYDMFLHSRDVPFTVLELYDWLDRVGLELVEFAYPLGMKSNYDPASCIKDPAVLAHVRTMPRRQQQAIADIINLRAGTHAFYAARRTDTLAQPGDDMVPSYFSERRDGIRKMIVDLANRLEAQPNQKITINGGNAALTFTAGQFTAAVLRRLDGETTFADICRLVSEDLAQKGTTVAPETIRPEVDAIYATMNRADWLLLRHKDVPAVPTVPELQARAFGNTAGAAATGGAVAGGGL